MKINDMYEKLNEKRSSLNDNIMESNLNAILSKLNGLKNCGQGYTEVRKDIKKLVKKFSLYEGRESLGKIQEYLNTIDNATASSIKGIKVAAETDCSDTNAMDDNNNTGSKSPRKFSDFLPLLISIVVLIAGIILGLTVFKQNQDLLYFILGGVEGIVSTGMSIVFIKQRVNSRKGNPHNKGIIASSCVIGLISLLFAIFLWLCSYMAIIERFTQWSKFAYLWVGLSCMILVSICAVIIICYLCPDSKKNKDDKESDV